MSSESFATVEKPGEHHAPPESQTFNQIPLPTCLLPARQDMLFQDRVDIALIHEAQVVDNLLNYGDLQNILDTYQYFRSS